MSQTVDLVALSGFLATVTLLLVQLVKPWIDRIPGITLDKNKDAHDSLLRIVQYALNFGLLEAASVTVPRAFSGLVWFDLLGLAFGQAIFSHVTYKLTTGEKITTPTVNTGGKLYVGTTTPQPLPTVTHPIGTVGPITTIPHQIGSVNATTEALPKEKPTGKKS